MVAYNPDADRPVLALLPAVEGQRRLPLTVREQLLAIFRAVKGESLLASVYRRQVAADPSDTELIDMARMAQDQIGDNRRIMRRVLGTNATNYIAPLVV